MKQEVYSWRVSEDLKSDLEREARLRKVPISQILETAVRDLLRKTADNRPEDEVQRALHKSAARCLGSIAGANPRRAETGRRTIREKLRSRYGR
jgi:post-segregation antitoxin (ccd killing protein)